MKLENAVQKFIENEIEILSLRDILERVLEGREKIKDKRADEVNRKADDICKKIIECKHPVVSKLLNLGYIKGGTKGKMLHNIKEVIKEMLVTEEEMMKREKLREELEKYKENIKKHLLVKIMGETMD